MNASARRYSWRVKDVAATFGVSEDTATRWCVRFGIGRQIAKGHPWLIDPVGAEIVASGDAEALRAYQAKDWAHPSLALYGEFARSAVPCLVV